MYNFVHYFHKWIKPTFAEFVATFIYLFWIGLFWPTESEDVPVSPLVPSVAVGMAATAIIIAFWDICLIQFNPAVTIILVIGEALPLRHLLPNIISQLSGALSGALAAYYIRG